VPQILEWQSALFENLPELIWEAVSPALPQDGVHPQMAQELQSFLTNLVSQLRTRSSQYFANVVRQLPAHKLGPLQPIVDRQLARKEALIRSILQARLYQLVRIPQPAPQDARPTPAVPGGGTESSTLVDLELYPKEKPKAGAQAQKVFVVHGRDESAIDAVQNVLHKLSLDPIILRELAGIGLTIIERLERHSDVPFAVVLLTPDDEGRLRGDETALEPRARQNVVMELGYFIGKLGRRRVCVLYDRSVEPPSDTAGMLYVPYDSAGAWKHELRKELRAAGLGKDKEAHELT
jgi:hypothetical protein